MYRPCQALHQDAAHCYVDECLAGFGPFLVINDESSVGDQPCECSFDHPSARKDVETLWDLRHVVTIEEMTPAEVGPPVLHHLDCPAQLLLCP